LGNFAHIILSDNRFSDVDEKFIEVLKEETDGRNETTDYVTNSPFNGWIERKAIFLVEKSDYKV